MKPAGYTRRTCDAIILENGKLAASDPKAHPRIRCGLVAYGALEGTVIDRRRLFFCYKHYTWITEPGHDF